MIRYQLSNAQLLVDDTQNYYGLKADISAAVEFITRNITATPGAFYDWIMRQN